MSSAQKIPQPNCSNPSNRHAQRDREGVIYFWAAPSSFRGAFMSRAVRGPALTFGSNHMAITVYRKAILSTIGKQVGTEPLTCPIVGVSTTHLLVSGSNYYPKHLIRPTSQKLCSVIPTKSQTNRFT